MNPFPSVVVVIGDVAALAANAIAPADAAVAVADIAATTSVLATLYAMTEYNFKLILNIASAFYSLFLFFVFILFKI